MSSGSLLSEFLSLVPVDRFDERYSADICGESYFGMPLEPIVACERRLRDSHRKSLAYFSMEYGLATSFYNKYAARQPLNPQNKTQEHEVFSNYRLADYFFTLKTDTIIDLPIYSGGLGVLAGDTVKTMADYHLSAAAIGMLWNAGYFRQKFWFKYGQSPEEMHWDMYSYPGLIPLKGTVGVSLRAEEVRLRLWKYYIFNYKRDYALPLILLDSNVEENTQLNRHLTDQLYRSDNAWIRIMQRVILGMGGVAALQALNYTIDMYHLNEGHAVFAFVAKARGLPPQAAQEALKKHFVYTCHTPVAAGHDRFSVADLGKTLKDEDIGIIEYYGKDSSGTANLTVLAMNASAAINAVAGNHQKVMHLQFPAYAARIGAVTNGVHTHTWISDSMMKVLEKYSPEIGDIKANPMALENVGRLRGDNDFRRDVWQAHQANKSVLCDLLGAWGFRRDVFTICWARRVAAYKRPSLIVQDVERLIGIAKKYGPLQIVFAGKAHPQDNLGFTFINEMLDTIDGLADVYDLLKIVMLENYEISLAKILTSGVDVWLNNPLPPFEASGTSGMKAVLNGVIQLSTLDGWVVEAQDRAIGRIFGYRNPEGAVGDESQLHMADDARALYEALDDLAQLYYKTNAGGNVDYASQWLDIMINCIACGSYFNTYRMLDEYKQFAWKF